MGCASSKNVQEEAPTNHVDVELAEAAAAERYHFKVGLSLKRCCLPRVSSSPASPTKTAPNVTAGGCPVRSRRVGIPLLQAAASSLCSPLAFSVGRQAGGTMRLFIGKGQMSDMCGYAHPTGRCCCF